MQTTTHKEKLNTLLKKWRKENPAWLIWAGAILTCLVLYFIESASLNTAVANMQDKIKDQKHQATWMVRASADILRLRKTASTHQANAGEPIFNIINRSINQKGLNNFVTDIHQIKSDQVQIAFKDIGYTDLITWLQALETNEGIYVIQATLQKTHPGQAQATVVLARNS